MPAQVHHHPGLVANLQNNVSLDLNQGDLKCMKVVNSTELYEIKPKSDSSKSYLHCVDICIGLVVDLDESFPHQYMFWKFQVKIEKLTLLKWSYEVFCPD